MTRDELKNEAKGELSKLTELYGPDWYAANPGNVDGLRDLTADYACGHADAPCWNQLTADERDEVVDGFEVAQY